MKIKLFAALLFILCAGYSAYGQEVSFDGLKEINGIKLYCKVIGKGEPVLVIHGGPGIGHQYFLPYMEELAKTHQLIFYDQRSTGKSAIPKDSLGASHENMINDIEALRKAFGISKVNLLTHSWGAKLVVNYALKYPGNIKSIIFSNPSPMNHDYDSVQAAIVNKKKYEPGFKEKKEEIQNKQISIIEIKMRFAFLGSIYAPETIDKIALTFPEDFADRQIALFKGLGSDWQKYDRDLYPELQKIKSPSLIIHGDADAMPVTAAERFTSSLANARLVRFEKSGHFPFIEEPQKFAETIDSFIKTVK
jgi:proline iminopeptidase